MKCINKSHSEYIDLANNSPYHPVLLDAKISIWQEQNNTDNFPTLEQLSTRNNSTLDKVTNAIVTSLPNEISNAVTVLDEVPRAVLGRDDLFLSLKDVFNDNGINDEMLINWAGINKAIIGHPKSVKSESQLLNLIEDRYNKKTNINNHPELKSNPLALESFNKWVAALDKYPVAFKDIMLSHAIKHLNPQRRSKYVLQLSDVALTQAYGLVVNKPHELNRIGKLYDQEVLKTVSDAVGHEPSASGNGYWVHIPRIKNTGIAYNTGIRDLRDNPKAPGKFMVEYMSEIDQDYEVEFFETREEAEAFEQTLKGSVDAQFKVNVELLRKLSPSTWCTASSRAPYNVEQYDNYILIVNGITVAGLEAIPYDNSALEFKKQYLQRLQNNPAYTVPDYYREKGNTNYDRSISDFEGETETITGNTRQEVNEKLEAKIKEIEIKHQKAIQKLQNEIKDLSTVRTRKVDDVTSIGNNGIAPIDHLDDIIAFFEKHNLDINNTSVQKALTARSEGKTDADVITRTEGPYGPAEGMDPFWNEGQYFYDEQPGQEFDGYDEYAYDEHIRGQEVAAMTTFDQAMESPLTSRHFDMLIPELRSKYEIALRAVEDIPYNINYIDHNSPFYNELAIKAVTDQPYVFTYLSQAAKELPGLREKYEQIELVGNVPNDDLPFSKTKTNQIQGYYDPKVDKVVVIASNTPIDEAAKIAIHEVAHRGMIRMANDLGGMQELSKALFAAETQLMEKVPELLKRTGHKNVEDLVFDYGFDINTQEGKVKLLSELAARWAETLVDKPKPTWWKTFIKSIQNWIKQFTGQTLSENEVNELIGGFVRYGTQNINNNDNKPVAPLNLNYPVTQDQFKNNLNYANISQEHKDGLELLVDANVPTVYLKTTLDDVEQTLAELQKILPAQYIELLPAVTIEDITFQEIAVKNPGIDLLKEEERIPVTSNLLTDAEIFETFSTFFSEGGVRSTRQDPNLDNMMINLLKSYGVDIVKGNDVNVEIDRMITQGIIGEEYRHKVWAFVHLMANGPSKAKVFLKPDGYVTKDLYEEAGHIFMSWLSDSTFNIQGIEFKPWEKPSSGTDYLSLTAYYKARHNEIRNHYLMRINNEIAKIYELINEKATATPERLDELDTLIDTPSNRKLKLLNEFEKNALADRLARIEISGKILGEALEARAEGRAYSTNASNKGISAFFTKWANAFVDFLYWVKSKFTGKEINTLRAALNSKSWLTDVGADAAQIEDYANQMEDLAEQIFGNNTKITPSKDLNFFETIASDHISEIDKLVNSIPEDLRQQQEVIENSIHELLANNFLDRYSDYLQDLSDEAVTQGIPPNLYIALRRLTPDGSARLKAAIDSFKLLSPQDKMLHAEKGVFHILKEALNKQTQFGNKDMGEIYKIFIEEGLKQVIVNNADPALLPTELGNFVKDFNTKLDNILTANIADGDIIPSLNTTKYNLYHGEFIEYQRRLKLLDENMAKINLIDAYIGNHKIKEALQLFLFGKTVVKNPGSVYEEKIDIPPLFKELDHINEDVDYRKDQINKALNKAEASGQLQQAALRNWENAGKVPNTPEALAYQAASAQYESDRAKVQYARPSTKQYELSYIKYKYFNEIFKTLNEENNGKLKILSYFPVSKQLEVKKILEDSAEKLKNMDAYFRDNDKHFMSEIGKALNTIQKDPANPDNDQKYALDSLVSDSTVAKDIGSLEKLMGAKMNHDPYWAHIVAHFYRLNKYAAIKTYDAFEFVKNSFEKNYEAIRKNRAITEIRKKTHTGSIQELFHEREDGKRTHYMLSPYLHGKLEREQQEYLQEIYKVLNKELEKRGHPGRIPTGNLPYDQEQRNEILQENADPELTDDPDLKEIRKMWQNYHLGYKINFNQPKSQQEIDRIIAEKEATLDPFALSQWKRTSMKKYYTVGRNGKTKQHILYLGELAIPSNRQSQEIINLAIPTDTEDVESFPIRLNKTDYINHEFNTLYSDPSFAELYDQMHKMQMEIYSLHQRNATWNRVKAYRTGAFAGGALDIGKRGFSLNLKLAVNRIGDLINDVVNISSENEFRIDPNKPQLPLHGVMPFTNKDGSYDADKLSDNYFDIISKYYHSVTQYDVKKKGLPQLEILRDLLKRRIVDAEVKRVKKIGQYGDDTLTLEETVEEKAIRERWSQFIDDAYENHVYEQHTKVNVGDTWRAKAYYITKMSALTTWWYLSGNTSSAIAARGQATKELFDMALNKRLMTSKGGILNAMMSIIKLYHKDRLNTVGEYFGNTILSKNTAIDSYLGLSNEHMPSIKYSNGLYKLLGDVTGLGVLKYANSRPRRMATERLLQNYKWIAAEGMFMNPSMYHRYLSKNSDVSLKYQDSLDKFELLGNNAYDMLEFKNGRIEATDPNIMNQERRAQLGVYLTEVHDKIDMADSDPSEFSRGIAGKMLLPLKKWLAKWGKMLFQNKFNAITGTEEKAYFQTIALFVLGGISKKRRVELRSRVNFHDDVREAFYKIISTAVLDAALAQLTLIAAQNAMGDCEGEKIDTWRCWWAAMAASTVARVKAEQGLYSTTNLLTNFDKPIASKQGTQKIIEIVSTVVGLPIEAITSNITGEDGDKPIQAGPYKDKTHGQKALISLLPFIRNPYEFFSPRGQVVRQQLITEQLNQDKIPLISFPGTWNSLIQGPILNKGYKFLYPNTPWEGTYPKVITTEQD